MRTFRSVIIEQGKIIFENIIDVYEDEQKIGSWDYRDTWVQFRKVRKTFYRKYKVSKKIIRYLIENCEEITK